MKVELWLDRLSQGIEHNAVSTYQKGDMFCVKRTSGEVYKYPVVSIFCVKETYSKLSHSEEE